MPSLNIQVVEQNKLTLFIGHLLEDIVFQLAMQMVAPLFALNFQA